MAMRELARGQYGRELQCHRNVAGAQVTHDLSMPQAIQGLSKDKRRALMQWLTRSGPFWDDHRQHGGDDYLECNGELVTDTAAGEAALRLFHGTSCGLVSMDPSVVALLAVGGEVARARVDKKHKRSELLECPRHEGRSRCGTLIARVVERLGDGGAKTMPRSVVLAEVLRAAARTPHSATVPRRPC